MQVKTLIFAAGLAAAAPQVTPTPAAPQVTPTPAADPTDGAFHLTTIHSGSEVHYSPFQAAQGRLSLKLPHNNASCDATTDGSATFYLGGINGDELFLYKNYNPPQQIYADRSAMGQGIVGYTTGAQPAPRNVELTRWAYDVDNGLTINGSGFLACPSADGSWALWVDAGVAQPAGYTGCLGIKARAFAEPNPVGCLYTQ